MQGKINAWTDVPGRQVDSVEWKPGDASAWFRFEEGCLEVESVEPGMPVVIRAVTPAADLLDVLTLTELKVIRVVVPFTAPAYTGDKAVIITFDGGVTIAIGSEDPGVAVRIS